MRALPVPLAFALLLLGPSAQAEDCDSSATQMALNACYAQVYATADAELNRLYGEISTRLAGQAETKALLVAAQRAWIPYRDAECSFASSGVAGGSIEPMIRAQCLTALTRARSADFARYLACEEGDLSCPALAPG